MSASGSDRCFDETMIADRRRLRVLARRATHDGKAAAAFETAFRASAERAAARRASLPAPVFPDDLPIAARRHEIAQAIAGHQVVIVAGATGSGKTTQLPKICLAIGRGVHGQIAHTQPRRVAARSIAARLATELGTELGAKVGYKVRFSDRTSPHCLVKVLTDGMLLAEVQSDPLLEHYDTVILDEAHERSLNIDFLLGYLKRLLPKRPDLKLVITSATLDTEKFARHFDGAPVIEVAGRSHPIEIRYRPFAVSAGDDRDLTQAILDAVDELAHEPPGDILVFLPGEREIRETAEALRKHHPHGTEILPLYARLSATEQDRIFWPSGRPRIVLATNVAETSLTVPGIRHVVDSGLARISRYSHRTKVQRLPIEPVARANADQRAGRCGRLGPGVCIRLYSEEDYAARPLFTEPEIRRTNLASVILQMRALGLGEIEEFPFVDPPDTRYVNDGYGLLQQLGALDPERRLTPLGRALARLPVDPRLGRMLLAARERGCLAELLIITAALAIQDPRERPHEARAEADEKHAQWHDPRSEFLAFVNLWNAYHERARHLSGSKLRAWCRENFLSFVRMREWHDVHGQLAGLMAASGARPNERPADYASVHKAILTGFIGHVGVRTEEGDWLGVRGIRFRVLPGSVRHPKPPRWLVAAQIVETERRHARIVARVEPGWIEEVAAHLVARHHSEPYWDARSGRVVAKETVTLYGLTLAHGRRVNHGPRDPRTARGLFIREALVGCDYHHPPPFLEHNHGLVEALRQEEARLRRRDLVASDAVLERLYDERLPAEVYDGVTFEHWYRHVRRLDPRVLYFSADDLTGGIPAETDRFPAFLELDGAQYPLRYRFEPGAPDDGVTLDIPVTALPRLTPARAEWLVPGLLEEKILMLIRGLPKTLRKNFVPAPEYARACCEALTFGEHSLLEQLSAQLRRMTGTDVPLSAWHAVTLPAHLRLHVRVLDNEGRVIAYDDDVAALHRACADHVRSAYEALGSSEWPRRRLVAWDFDTIPAEVVLAGGTRAFPALRDAGNAAEAVLCGSADEAAVLTREGVFRLVVLALEKEMKYLRRMLAAERVTRELGLLGLAREPAVELADAALRRLLAPTGVVREKMACAALVEACRRSLIAEANALVALVSQIVAAYREVREKLGRDWPSSHTAALADVREQLAALLPPGFVARTDPDALTHLPRYLAGIAIRLERLGADNLRDSERMADVRAWQARLESLRRASPDDAARAAALEALRWQLEEYRISLFAQPLRTAGPVSARRLEQLFAALDKNVFETARGSRANR